MNEQYLIWSHEHRAWWGPNSSGYTIWVAEAGRYSLAEAGAITMNSIPHGEEIGVPESEAMMHGTAYVRGVDR